MEKEGFWQRLREILKIQHLNGTWPVGKDFLEHLLFSEIT